MTENNAEIMYYLGMSYINIGRYNQGIEKLVEVIKTEPEYKRSLYLALALAFKKL